MKRIYVTIHCPAAVLALLVPAHAFAQETQSDENVIVVTGQRLAGGVDTDVQPIAELGESDINALGASSVADVVAAISPQTSSGRGRGGGMPIILLNGQRVSGFRELRDLPPEAIRQVQVFPEEVALQYGFRPDQRVINFVLKDGFASASGEVEVGSPEDGGYTTQEIEANFTTIGKSTRLNLNAVYERSGYLTQNERGIFADSTDTRFAFDGDINAFRTLRPATDKTEVNGTFTKLIAPQTNLSLNANYQVLDSSSLLGLTSANLILPGTSPFSPAGSDQTISRYFTAPRPLERQSQQHTANFGLSLNSRVGGWRYALTSDYGRVVADTLTNRNADFAALQAALTSGAANPFASDFGRDLQFLPPDISESISEDLNVRNSLAGTLLAIPSGEIQMSLGANYGHQSIDSRSVRSNIEALSKLTRDIFSGSANIDIPLIARDLGPLGFLGEFAVNGNIGLTNLSDFGELIDYTAGVRWSPTKGLSFTASVIGDENAPPIGQLGAPILTTPNSIFFDFARNETVLIDLISGGNSLLAAENRRDLKLAANWSPAKIDNLNIQLEYFRNRSKNTTAAFPLLTPEIEAAFASRVVRRANGELASVDRRPVNFAEENSQRIRWGINFSGQLSKEPERGGGPAGDPAGGRPARGGAPGAGGPGRGGAGGPGRGGPGGGPPGFGPPQGGRWQIAMYHTYQIQDEILIAPGIPTLDLLNGSATSNLGGTPRHRIELSGGLFKDGLGMRVEGNYRSSTRADGDALVGNSDLTFSDLATLNLRLFVNLDDRGQLTKKIPILKGARIAFSIDNALNDIIDVRDGNGAVPLSYQPGFLDPVGRYFEISFRKRF